MKTGNIELTSAWTLIATGPQDAFSFEPSKEAKYTSLQVAIAASEPAANLRGHPIEELRGADLAAGENLYARASGQRALMIITYTQPS